MKKPFVRVTWLDAEDYPGTWANEEKAVEFANKPCEVLSYGYLIKKTRKYVCIAADYIALANVDQGDFGRISKIPMKMVTKIEPLTLSPSLPVEPVADKKLPSLE